MQITRRFEFDAGHRVHGHGGKCKYPHGHRYRLDVTVEAPELNDLGMVIDFGDIKSSIGQWIDDNVDHGFIVWSGDPCLGDALRSLEDSKVIQVHGNPTAEFLVVWLYEKLRPVLQEAAKDVKMTKLVLFETPNCSATYEVPQ